MKDARTKLIKINVDHDNDNTIVTATIPRELFAEYKSDEYWKILRDYHKEKTTAQDGEDWTGTWPYGAEAFFKKVQKDEGELKE